jgi:DNA-binding beta-propeller fold protein YncE
MQTLLGTLTLLGAIVLAGCGGNSQATYNNGSGNQPLKPKTHLQHRAIVSNYETSLLDVVDVDASKNLLTSYVFPVGTAPTYLQPSPDGTLTFVNNTGSSTISSFNNNQEAVLATIVLCPPPATATTCNSGGMDLDAYSGFVTSVNNQVGFAAVPGYFNGSSPVLPGGIERFDPLTGVVNPDIPFPYVANLAMDPAEKHLLVFTKDDTASPNGDDNAYWVDLTTTDPTTGLPPISVLALPAGALSSPVAAFFSADSTKAYILNCGTECGGSSSPSVTEIDAMTDGSSQAASYLPSILQGTATVVNQWTVSGARIGLIDLKANMLYVAGTNPINNDGYFTVINLATPPPSNTTLPSIPGIGNGMKRWIRNINGTFWVASLGCENCITLVNPTAPPATVLPNANGNATGISLMVNSGDVYTVEGGYLYIYDQTGNPVLCDGVQCPITGVSTGRDVLYID